MLEPEKLACEKSESSAVKIMVEPDRSALAKTELETLPLKYAPCKLAPLKFRPGTGFSSLSTNIRMDSALIPLKFALES